MSQLNSMCQQFFSKNLFDEHDIFQKKLEYNLDTTYSGFWSSNLAPLDVWSLVLKDTRTYNEHTQSTLFVSVLDFMSMCSFSYNAWWHYGTILSMLSEHIPMWHVLCSLSILMSILMWEHGMSHATFFVARHFKMSILISILMSTLSKHS
jgi:hypothetical protein